MWKAPKQLIVLCLGAWGLVYGQTEWRTSLIESARTEKEANLTPEKPPKIETRIEAIEHSLPYRLLTSETGGLGVGLGNIVPGAGLAAGPQFTRTGLWHGRINLSVQARASMNESYLGRMDLSQPHLFGDRVSLDFSVAHRDISEMPYYGPGPNSRKTGRSDYRLEDTNVELRPGVRLYKGLRASLIGSYLANNVGPGHSSRYISSDQQFGPNVAPGIDRQTNFWRGGGAFEYDWRDRPSDPTSGGKYSAQYVRYLEQARGACSFLRLDLDASQYIPMFNRTRVIALRGASSLTTTSGNQRVPFYLQPALGGPDTEAWFSRVLPVDKFRIVDGGLAFEDLGARGDIGKAREYSVRWARWDDNGRATPVADPAGSQIPAFRSDTQFLAATIQLAESEPEDHPVTVYLRRGQTGPEVLGIDR